MFCLDILLTGDKNLMFLRHLMLTLIAAVLIISIKHRIHSFEVKKEIEFKVIPLFKTYSTELMH